MESGMKVVGYIRVSTDGQEESGLGLADQAQKIKSYCTTYDLKLVDIIQDAASGKNMERPGLQDALARLENGEAEGLVVAKLDRLTRSVKDMGILLEDYFQDKFAFFVVTEKIDTQSAAGRLFLNILTGIAQWERETIGERTKAALRQKKERGEKTGGHVPYGWKLEGDKMKEDPEEQAIIGKVHRWRERGKSFDAICRHLNKIGVATKTGRLWNPGTLYKIVQKNPRKV